MAPLYAPENREDIGVTYQHFFTKPIVEVRTNMIRRPCSRPGCVNPIKVGDLMIVVDDKEYFHQLCYHGEHKK